MKSLLKTVALITIFSFLTRISGFIFRMILSRQVGAEGVGLYQVAFSVFMVLTSYYRTRIREEYSTTNCPEGRNVQP